MKAKHWIFIALWGGVVIVWGAVFVEVMFFFELLG